MAQLLNRTWTAADGTTWDDVGFRRVSGGAIDAVVSGNRGACGAFASERVYLVTGYSQETNQRGLVDLLWATPAASGRAPYIVARYTEDGARGYGFFVDSNIGAPRARLMRRDGAGGWTDLTGWVALAGFGITATELAAGVTCELNIRNATGQVELAGIVMDQEVVSFTDSSASRVEAGGTWGLGIDANSVTTDVLYDNLQVHDLEAEYAGDPAQLSEGLALVVDGTYYAEADLLDANGVAIVTVERVVHSFDKDQQVTLRTSQRMDGADAIVYPGAIVQVLYDGTTLAFGRIRPATRALRPKEGRAYRLTGCRGLAADVLLHHPKTGEQSWQWNLPTTHAEYDAEYADKTLAEALTQLAEEHVDGEDGLRAALAAPPDEGTPLFNPADLALLHTEVLPFLSVTGPDVLAAVEQLLSHTRFALFIAPDTRQWRLKKRLAGAIEVVALDVQGEHVTGEFSVDPDRNFSAVLVVGSKPEVDEIDLDNGVAEGRVVNNGLEPDWEPTLKAAWTSEKGKRNTDAGAVDSISGTVGAPTMTPAAPFTMDALEWKLCRILFRTGAEAGEVYDLTTNTGLAFTLVGPWRNGGPAAGDLFVVEGNAAGGGRDNGYREVGRRYKLTDTTLGIPQDVCAQVKVVQEKLEAISRASVRTPADPAEPATVTLDLPAIGLFNRPRQQDQEPCTPGGAVVEARVEVKLPTYVRADPRVPTMREPAVGFTGTSFTWDSAKWEGAGTPGKGDVAVARVFPLPVPEYDGAAATEAAWRAVAQEHLAYLSPLAYTAVLELKGLVDLRWAGLGMRLQVTGGPTELETTTDLDVLAVEFDLEHNVTRLFGGTTAAGEYDLQAMRREMLARHNLLRQKRQGFTLQQLQDCLGGKIKGAAEEGPPPSGQLCADQATSAVAAPGNTVKEDLETIILWIEWWWDWLEAQKGFTVTTDDDGNLWVMDPDGEWVYSEDGGETWKEDISDDGPAGGVDGGDPAADSPIPNHPEDLGDESIEGIMWSAIEGILANLGKTVDQFGNVLAPGSTVPAGGGTQYGHDAGGGIIETPLAPGATVPPTVIGGIQANKAALEKLVAGLAKSADHVVPASVTSPDGSVYTPSSTGYVKVSGGGLAGPQLGGAVGGLGGKCGTTFDGAAAFGSGPGAILEPGSTVGSDGAYYHPPTDDPADVMQLGSGDTVPASTPMQARAVGVESGLQPVDKADPGGVVYTDESGGGGSVARFWRCNPTLERMVEVELTSGTGLNGGDWSDVSPTAYHEGVRGNTWKRAALAATTAALPANTRSDHDKLTADANGALAAQDGVPLAVGDRLLVKNEASAISNGLYFVSSLGSAGTPWVLKRTQDANRADSVRQGALVYIRDGSTQGGLAYAMQETGFVTPHTDAQTWAQWPDPSVGSHVHDAGDITTGVLDGDRIPAAAAAKFGGVKLDAGWGTPTLAGAKNGVTSTTTHNQLLAIVAGLQEAFMAGKIPAP